MKRKFSKILGVGLTLSLLISLLLTAAPVSAAEVSQPAVDVDPDEISLESEYTISFRINKELEASDNITVKFPEDTDLDGLVSYDAHLESTGPVGTSGEDRIVIPMPAGTTLDDIDSIAWWVNTVAGYPPHVDITLDCDEDGIVDDEDMLTAEMAYNCVGKPWDIAPLCGSMNYPTGWLETFELTADDGYGEIDDTTMLWVTKMGAGDNDAPSSTLEEWKAGTVASDPDNEIADNVIDGTAPVVKLEIEVDSWVVLTNAYVKDIAINDVPWGGITISATSGIGSDAFSKVTPESVTVDTDDLTIKIVLPGNKAMNPENKIGAMASVQIVIDGVINPTESGAYTVEVKTSEEKDYAESETYDIDPRTLGGAVYVYNDAGQQLDFLGGAAALDAADDAGYFDTDDFTVTVGPGTYLLGQDIEITGDDFTLNSSDGADETEIDCDEKYGIIINSGTDGDTTIDGFTINDANVGITINGDDAVIKNCIIKDADGDGPGILILAGGTGAKISDNVFDANKIAAIQFEAVATTPADMDSLKITGNEIEGGDGDAPGILLSGGNQDIEITGNTISANEGSGIEIVGDVEVDDVLIKGNTISGNEGHGIHINATAAPTKLEISENDIVDNIKSGKDGIRIDQTGTGVWGVTSVIIFNNFSGNGSDAIQNDSDDDVNAFLNWWGSAVEDDFDGDIEEDGSGDINYEPWLTAEFGTSVSAGDVKTNVSSLDGKDDVGVSVTGMVDDLPAAAPDNAELIGVAKYAANPGDDIDDAIAFFDVLVILEEDCTLDEISARLKFYDSAINTGSVAHFWTGDFWAECSDQLARSGIVWVTITEDTIPTFEDLEGTPFAVVAGEAVDELTAPVLLAPEVGDDDVALTPTFAWGAVTDADGYHFEFADNANFVFPLVSMTGDYGRLVVTAYAYMTELPYSTGYYWRVKAVSGTEEGGDLEEGAWASGVFITKDEPEEVTPPIVVEEAPPVVIKPIVEVITPAAEMITPSWIYVIIGVGAVLVIALLVLIVRTRRVA